MGSETSVTWEGLRAAIERLCEERGWHHGVAMPSSTNTHCRLIPALHSPISDSCDEEGKISFFQEEKSKIEDGFLPYNYWRKKGVEVQVWSNGKKTERLSIPEAWYRFRMMMDTLAIRVGAVSADAELTAMMALQRYINKSQFESYILNGAFPESSPRSKVTYILRKGLPTLALRLEQLEDGKEKQNFLAALCLHPLAYYEETLCGSYPPSDEVLTHLLLIRTDEHYLWRKAGQHAIDDPRAGI